MRAREGSLDSGDSTATASTVHSERDQAADVARERGWPASLHFSLTGVSHSPDYEQRLHAIASSLMGRLPAEALAAMEQTFAAEHDQEDTLVDTLVVANGADVDANGAEGGGEGGVDGEGSGGSGGGGSGASSVVDAGACEQRSTVQLGSSVQLGPSGRVGSAPLHAQSRPMAPSAMAATARQLQTQQLLSQQSALGHAVDGCAQSDVCACTTGGTLLYSTTRIWD